MTNLRKPAKARKQPARRIEASKTVTDNKPATNNTEACNTATLLTAAKEALEQFIDVKVDDDGALSFQHAGVPGAVQAVQLAEGLVVLSLTCVVAWDVPAGDGDLAARLAMRAGEGLFGTLGVVHTKAGYDVTLRYAFPAAGLEPVALGTLLMLVISTASQLRTELVPT